MEIQLAQPTILEIQLLVLFHRLSSVLMELIDGLPKKFISPLAGVAVGASNDAIGGGNFTGSGKWSGFVAPHVGVMLGKHFDVRFSYYLAPKDFNRGMLSLGYKF